MPCFLDFPEQDSLAMPTPQLASEQGGMALLINCLYFTLTAAS